MSTKTKSTPDCILELKKTKTTEDVFTYKQALEFLESAEEYLYSGSPLNNDRAVIFQDWLWSKVASACAIVGFLALGPSAPIIEDQILMHCTNWDNDTFVEIGMEVRDNAKKIAGFLSDRQKYDLARVEIETTAYSTINPIGGGTVYNFSIISGYKVVALRMANGAWIELV